MEDNAGGRQQKTVAAAMSFKENTITKWLNEKI